MIEGRRDHLERAVFDTADYALRKPIGQCGIEPRIALAEDQ